MIEHRVTSCLMVSPGHSPQPAPLISYLNSIAHISLSLEKQTPRDLSSFDVVITTGTSLLSEDFSSIEQFVMAGGGWLALQGAADGTLPDIFGARPDPAGPEAEVRVLFQDRTNPLAARLPDAFYASGIFLPLSPAADNAEIVLYCDWHYQHRPVLISRAAGSGRTACTTLQDYTNPCLQQILYRVIRRLHAVPLQTRELGVGILGYAPSMGRPHGIGAQRTPGLALAAVCDVNQERIEQASRDFPGVKTYASADRLANDPEVDVVIIVTPPDSHADLCLHMMSHDKHVVCEKPLALHRKETDDLADMAHKRRVHLSCHQNRRWDVDYLAIKQALAENLIGELFYLETFVGSFSHPCGYWHSHAPVSGGTAYDWGGHYIDWIVSLVPARAASVVCTRHKRVWHDVTNYDQERIQIRFDDGREAEFLHSDIAAVRKPKWYMLGTAGAIAGSWRDITTYEIDPVVYFYPHEIPPTEMPPDLTLYRHHRTGRTVPQKLPVPHRQDYGFHRNLADHLLTGEPIAAPLEQSVTVVAILEAAVRSAENGGSVEGLDG